MSRRTKIVATIGPASGEPEMIEKLLDAGVNVFRLNFSHGSQEGHKKQTLIIREVLERKQMNAAILGDLQGPKIRIGDLSSERILEHGDQIILTTNPNPPEDYRYVPVRYKPLPDSVGADDTLLLDDGLIRLSVSRVVGQDVHCVVDVGGTLKSRKGLNRLGGGLSAAAITAKDLQDIDLAVELELDYLAVSFPSSAQDLEPVKQRLKEQNTSIPIISKIERAEVVEFEAALDALILASDGVMVARGDLGVEIGDPQLIGIQKQIIRRARRANRTVITATQMMESMINAPVPTRAEVFDVANAVLDGTDAVMLSAETATGRFPSLVVKAMAETCVGAEKHPDIRKSSHRIDRIFENIDEAIAMSTVYTANHLRGISAIICLTETGETALWMSRLSSRLPIFAISRHHKACQKMALYRGVQPIYYDVTQQGIEDIFESAVKCIVEIGALCPRQRVVISCGDIQHKASGTNQLKVLEVM
ncbi:MAG: pyruvate kinase [Halieaceae bacterium]|nr:pyruvate kinase [Halieaceae bacterium]